jgi:hypothetical protein
MKKMHLLILVLFFASCNSKDAVNNDCIKSQLGVNGSTSTTNCSTDQNLASDSDTNNQGDNSDTTTNPTNPDIPNDALTWDANIYFANFSANQEDKVLKAVELMKEVIASEEFRNEVINYTYNGSKSYVDNDGFTNEEIYQIILDGAEIIGNKTKNNTLDVELELYFSFTSTIGYTNPSTTRIWMNTKYFNNYTAADVTGNLMHEWLHKLGFGHASTWSTSRDHSVPYAIGYLMAKMARELEN